MSKWLKRRNRKKAHRHARRRASHSALQLETLEDRRLLAIVTWDGGGAADNWSEAANWSADTLPGNSDTVVFDATSTKNAAVDAAFGGTIKELQINTGYTGTIALDRNLTVNGNFAHSDGNFDFDTGMHTLAVDGNFTVTAAAGFDAGDGTVEFSWNQVHTSVDSAAPFNDVVFSRASGFSITANQMDVNGDLVIQQVGGINGTISVAGNVTTHDTSVKGTGKILFDGSGNQVLSAAVDGGEVAGIEIDKPSGTLTISAPDKLRVSGSWTQSAGSVQLNVPTVEFSWNQIHTSVDSFVPFNDVVFARSSGFSITANQMDVNGDLVIQQMGGINGTVSAAGNVTTHDTRVTGSGKILLDGTGDQVLSAAVDRGEVPGIEIDKPSGTLTIDAPETLTVSGSWKQVAGTVQIDAPTVEFSWVQIHTSVDSAAPFNDVVFNRASGFQVTVTQMDIDGDLAIRGNNNRLTGMITVAGNVTSYNSSVGGNGTIVMDGSQDAVLTGDGADFPNGGVNIDKSGDAAVTLGSDVTASSMRVNQGTLDLDGRQLAVSGGTLAVEPAGTLAVYLDAAALTQAAVTGSVTLGGSLDVHLLGAYVPTGSETFTLVSNDQADSVAGTFTGLPEGATLLVAGTPFQLSYQDGTGNDVVLLPYTPPVANDDFGSTDADTVLAANITTPIVSYLVQAGTVGNQQFSGSLGMDFDVNSPIVVTQLGVFDSSADGLNRDITAHLYDRANMATPLVTLSFTTSAPGVLVDGSRFKDLPSPLILAAGFQGTIVAENYGSGEPNGNQVAVSHPELATDGGGLIEFVGSGRYGAAGSFPTSVDGGPVNSYAAGTFGFLDAAAQGLLANDVDRDPGDLSVVAFDATSAQGAAVSVNPDGTFTYNPTLSATLAALKIGETADDTFTYTISDGIASDSATVTVTVSGVAPNAIDDMGSTDADTPLVAGGGYAGVVLGDNPLAYWRLNETSGSVAVDEVGGNDGVYGAGLVLGQPGPQPGNFLGFETSNAAPQFDRDDFGSVVEMPDVGLTSNVGSVSLWFNTTLAALSDTLGGAMLFYGSDSGGDGFGGQNEFHVHITPEGTLGIFIEGGPDVRAFTTSAQGNFADGQWHHVVFAWDINAQASLYADNVEVLSVPHDANSFSFSSAMLAGRPTANNSLGRERIFEGLLDEVAIYNTALTAEQIADHYHAASAAGVLVNDVARAPISVSTFDATSAHGASVNVDASGGYIYDPTVSAGLSSLPLGDTVVDTFTYTITDGSRTDSATVSITVTGTSVNSPPQIDSQNFHVYENGSAVGTVAATDPDLPNDTLTFSLTGNGPDDAAFAITSEGVLSFVNAPDYENPTDVGGTAGDSVYEVEVEVSDSANETATATITVNVDPVNDNAPEFTSSTTASVTENTTAVQNVSATDADLPAQSVTYSIAGSGPDNALFQIVGGNQLEFIAPPDYEAPLDADEDNIYEVEVEADDNNGLTTTQTVQVSVLNQASITGTVFVDVNENGLYDANEPGIDGVLIELLDELGAPVLDDLGTPITATTSGGGFYLFEDLDPGVYQVFENQPTGVDDGAEHLGSLGGAAVANDTMQLALDRTDAADYVFAELGQDVTTGDTATIGFWQNKHGQELIAQGGTALADWLTDNFGNVFGDELAGASGSDVASFYKSQLFKQKGKKSAGPAKVDAQFMATALATYFTSSNLAGTVAAGYGFNVTQTGIGTKIVNVGSNGAAFNVADNTDLTIMQLLVATNDLTDLPDGISGFAHIYDANGDGVIDSDEASLRSMANEVYNGINEDGEV